MDTDPRGNSVTYVVPVCGPFCVTVRYRNGDSIVHPDAHCLAVTLANGNSYEYVNCDEHADPYGDDDSDDDSDENLYTH